MLPIIYGLFWVIYCPVYFLLGVLCISSSKVFIMWALGGVVYLVVGLVLMTKVINGESNDFIRKL